MFSLKFRNVGFAFFEFSFFLVFSLVRAEEDSLFTTVKVKQGDALYKLFGPNWEIVSRINRVYHRSLRKGMVLKVPKNWEWARSYSPLPDSFRQISHLEKFVVVDLENQYYAAYHYGKQQFWGPISSGLNPKQTPHEYIEKVKRIDFELSGRVYRDKLPDLSTPAGFFKILGRDSVHASSIFNTAEGSAVPMPWATMFFRDRRGVSYWFHEIFWPVNTLPGFPASHGCIRVLPGDGRRLYFWAKYKTLVLIAQKNSDIEQMLDNLPKKYKKPL